MKKYSVVYMLFIITLVVICSPLMQCSTQKLTRERQDESGKPNAWNASINENANDMLVKGKAVFRFETFGNEVFWTDELQLHKAIADSKHGGNGAGLSPK